ncbi:MAG: TM2 domain-containing protein [Clostridiales bacterium]|nr:TM2 domain-containing protein [Clostridiales bacterium]
MKCPNCGAPVTPALNSCSYCGGYLAAAAPPAPPQPTVVYKVIHQHQPVRYVRESRSDRRRWVAFLLCLFMGHWGIHKFYLGRIGLGLLYMFTFGLFGIGWLVDLVLILTGAARDREGRRLS